MATRMSAFGGRADIIGTKSRHSSVAAVIPDKRENFFRQRSEIFGPYLEKHFRKDARQHGSAPRGSPHKGESSFRVDRDSYAKMPVMTPNANTPNVMLVTPITVYFMSKVAARATMTLVMACSIDTRSKA